RMIADDEVKMLLFGGGEVCNEILPFIDFEAIKKHPKIICSYSDSTTILNAISSRCNLVTFYGQSLRTFLNLTDYNYKCFQSAFMQGDIPEYIQNSQWKTLKSGCCEGRLLGGYLVNFAIMLNGNYLKYDRDEKHILFIEDHIKFSQPAVVSKFFSHIEQSGLFNSVSGLIFGHYGAEDTSILEEILCRLGEKYNRPVVRNGDFGHCTNNVIIPLGITAKLN
ncbi:LD-carboxypeptidase, partial [Cutibacterium acnes]